jgi:hypothetical protein
MTNLPYGEVGADYEEYLIEDENGSCSNTTSIVGTLPPGLKLEDFCYNDWYYIAYIYGEPTQTGTFSFTVEATNGDGSVTRNFTILIKEPQPPVFFEDIQRYLPDGEKSVFYHENIYANGNLHLESGELPPGLVFDEGLILGYPT